MNGPELSAGISAQLRALAEALRMRGLRVEERISEQAAVLKVWHPDLSVTGLCVLQESAPEGGVPWFHIYGSELSIPSDGVPGAAACIHGTLEAVIASFRGRRWKS